MFLATIHVRSWYVLDAILKMIWFYFLRCLWSISVGYIADLLLNSDKVYLAAKSAASLSAISIWLAIDLLKEPSYANITKIHNFIKETKLKI